MAESAVTWGCVLCDGPFRGVVFHPMEWASAFNPEVISADEVEWIRDMRILGYNKEAPGATKAFLAHGVHRGRYDAAVLVRAGPAETRDPNFPGPSSRDSYLPSGNLPREVKGEHFLIHQACLELLASNITGCRGSDIPVAIRNLDKDALYLTLLPFHLLSFSHPTPDPRFGFAPQSTCRFLWRCVPGYEYFVANPGRHGQYPPREDNPVTRHLRTLIASEGSTMMPRIRISPETASDLSSRVRADPFRNLPIELLYKISELFDNRALFNWCAASWTIRCTLRANPRFWRYRITRVTMPWLDEIVPVLDDKEAMQDVDLGGLLRKLDSLTQHKQGLAGPLLGVANRRRVWRNAEVYAMIYDVMVRRIRSVGLEAAMQDLYRTLSCQTAATQ